MDTVNMVVFLVLIYGGTSLIVYGLYGIMLLIRKKYYTEYYKENYVKEFKKEYIECMDYYIGEIISIRLAGKTPHMLYKFDKKKIFWLFRDYKYVRKLFHEVLCEIEDLGYKIDMTDHLNCEANIAFQLKE